MSTYQLIARKDGSSASRRQRRFPDLPAVERAVARWRAAGFNTWWIFDDDGAVVRQWIDEQPPGERTRDE